MECLQALNCVSIQGIALEKIYKEEKRMKKPIALLLALVMVIGLVACGAKEEAAAPEAAPAATEAAKEEAPAAEEAAPAEGPMSEEDAEAAVAAGTMVEDAQAGYGYSESTGNWYYSNYPNYKDFNADGKLKVAFVCKFSGAWFTPKANSLGETVEAEGCEYLFIDANGDEQAWIDGVDNIIAQDFDAVCLTPPNTELLADALAKLQEAGIAYCPTDDPGPDAYGFYAPHIGLDDYFLHNELGKFVAEKIVEEKWLDGVDLAKVAFLVQDAPAVQAIHLRNQGFVDGIAETFPDLAAQAKWMDCGKADTADCAAKFGNEVSAYLAGTEKWLISGGGAATVVPTVTILKENGVDMANVKIADCFSTADPVLLMLQDPTVQAYGATLYSAPSGVLIGEQILKALNGEPMDAFTAYDLLITHPGNTQEIKDQVFPDA